ncbi:hypothetical protein [Sphingopyxis sp. KK2]|uniref:hypothetical protein n=1 Tax=Sphingopyxis sp. KK2 TaxID=1855727 RepID=UPI00097E5696|nr:hypothetical protein [Sphingopyxis sp. KK2]
MIEHLVVDRSAYFYRGKRRLSQDAIDRLFGAVRAKAAAPSQNMFRAVRSPMGETLYSAICFSYERPVAFFDEEADVLERVFGFLMIIEKDDYVAVVTERQVAAHHHSREHGFRLALVLAHPAVVAGIAHTSDYNLGDGSLAIPIINA